MRHLPKVMQKKAEKEPLRFQSIVLDSIGEAVIATDISGTVLYWNKAAEKLYGWRREEVLGRKIMDITIAEQDSEQGLEIMASLQASECWSGEFLVLHRDGHSFYANVTNSSLKDEQGNVTVIIGVSYDLTEKRRLTAAAETASRFKSEFIAHMSHELRTPLTIIRGYAELIVSREPDQEIRAWLDTIIRSSSQMELLIGDVLDISRIESGKVKLEKEWISVDDLIKELRSLHTLKALEKNIAFDFSLDGPVPAQILTDPLRLKQILINLIGNAMKFTYHGFVKVSVKLADPSTMIFTVADSGIGISSDQRANIFEAFNQADNSISRRFGGTGLGLSVSLGIARLLGGNIVLSQSELNVGSTFTVSINPGPIAGMPLLDANSISGPSTPSLKNGASIGEKLRGMKILLVEDAEDIRALVSFVLQSQGAVVTLASHGGEAVHLAEKSAFDLILMDIQMPIMDGYAAVQKLRGDHVLSPIFAMTAHAMSGERERCLAAGFTDYLTKPLDLSKLMTMISTVDTNLS